MPTPSASTLLLLKLTLAPGLIGLASVLMTRFGPHVGGIVAALPAVSGPILLLYALEQGLTFTAQAARATLLGTVALLTYATVYAQVARRFPARSAIGLCLLLGYLGYFVVAAALGAMPWPSAALAPLALLSVHFGIKLLPRVPLDPVLLGSVRRSLGLIVTRMLVAAALVWSLTEIADRLGPTWSGLLTAFPVIGTVMLVATHLERGLGLALAWLRGFLWGLYGYVAFVGCVAYGLERLGVAGAFGLGLVSAALAQGIVRRVLGRNPPEQRG